MEIISLAILFLLCLPFLVRNASDKIIENREEQRRQERIDNWEARVLDEDYQRSITPRGVGSFRDYFAYSIYREREIAPKKREAFAYVAGEIEKKHPGSKKDMMIRLSDDHDYMRILMAQRGKILSIDSQYFGISGGLDDYRGLFVEWIDDKLREHGVCEPLYYKTSGTQWGGGVFAKSAWDRVPDIWRTKGSFVWEPGLHGTENIIR